jgi:hypothetical protein
VRFPEDPVSQRKEVNRWIQRDYMFDPHKEVRTIVLSVN